MNKVYLNPEQWQLFSMADQAELLGKKNKNEDPDKKAFIFDRLGIEVSPLTLYEYLKSRFGNPNGFSMLFKGDSSDNLIHWHYSLHAGGAFIDILGKNTGTELVMKFDDYAIVPDDDWKVMVGNLKNEFKKHAKEIKQIHNTLEQWNLFINPYVRIDKTLQDSLDKLDRLKLIEATPVGSRKKSEREKYHKEFDKWVGEINQAATLGTTIRMLCPVLAEAFVNLILLVFRKEEYQKDERMYDNALRQPIDIRVKSLHNYCSCFPSQIDGESEVFKKFHTLMNSRNDFLHGNIDPRKLVVDEVYFDMKITPLFKNDERYIQRMLKFYCRNVEPDKARSDYKTVSDFIEMILMAMEEKSLLLFTQFMSDAMPGINKKTKKLGSLFRADVLVEGYGYNDE